MRRVLLAAIVLGLAALTVVARADDDKGLLAGFISRALSSKDAQVSIGEVEGALSSDATIRDIVISDRDGPWLKVDRARLVWRRLALLQRRLEIDDLEIGHIVWSRAARKSEPTAPGGPTTWPDLPLKAIVKAFRIDSVDFGAPVLGEAARLAFAGEAKLGSPLEGLDLTFSAQRLDAPGTLKVGLTYAPATSQLRLAFDADEPQGGVIAKAARLPGAPPVQFRLDGSGPLDGFHAGLAFSAGRDIGARGDIDLVRAGAGRELKLDLSARLAGLLPQAAAPVFAGETQLGGIVRLEDDGSVRTRGVTLESAAAALDVVGGVGADGVVDIDVRGHAKPNQDIGKLDVGATVKGPLPRPAAEVTAEVERLRSSTGTLGKFSARFTAQPVKPGDADAPVALTGEAEVADLLLAEPARAALIGHRGKLHFQATALPDGTLDVAMLGLNAEALRARFSGKAARDAISGRLEADADDLGRLAPLTGLAIRGAAHGVAGLSGNPSQGDYAAEIHADAKGFGTGESALDGFLGSNPALQGGVKINASGYVFNKLALTGAGSRALIDGTVAPGASDLTATLAVTDARKLDGRVAGSIAAEIAVHGPISTPDVRVAANIDRGRLLGRPAPRISLTANATGGAALNAKIDGEIDSKALQGELAIVRTGDDVSVNQIGFALGDTRAQGAGKWIGGLGDGHFTLDAPRLEDLSPLALTPLSGSLYVDAQLDARNGLQNAALRARSGSAGLGAVRVNGLDANLRVTDVFGDVRAEGVATAASFAAGGESISSIKLNAKEKTFGLAATLRGMALRARGALDMSARTLRLDDFSARGRSPAITLAEPATLAFGDGGLSTSGLSLKLGSGRLAVKGRAGRTFDLQARAEAVPLALADMVSPGLGLSGTASAEARLRGDASAPEGDWRLSLTQASAPAVRAAGLPPVEAKASGRLAGTTTSLDATISAGAAGALRLAGAAPLHSAGALDLRATGRLDVAALTRALAARGQRANGTLTVDARLNGDIAHPRATGSAALAGGAFADEVTGLRITDLSAAIAARGDEIEIVRASGRTPGGGSVSASGRVKLDPAAGYPGAIKLNAENARLLATEIVTADAGFALELTGPLAHDPLLAGRIDVKAIDVEIPGRLPGADVPLADVRHINPGPAVRLRIAHMDKKRRATGPDFAARLALSVAAPSRVAVHGRGVDAEFGGQLQVKGTTNAPQIVGGFDLRRGALTLIGGPMTFSRGQVSFDGDATPQLDLEASETLTDVTAIVDVTGAADRPVFSFSSNPSLPQDEILSRILFQKPSGSLSAFQALQLANTVSSLSGNGGAFDKLRRTLGVDSLDVSSGSGGGPVVGARRAIGNRLSLGVSTGARPQDNGVSLDYDVTQRLKLSTGVDAKGESNLGAGLHWEY